MTIIETVLVFIGIPLGMVALLAFAVFGRSMLHQPNRYRPGRPWSFAAVWFVPHPAAIEGAVTVRTAIEGAAPSATPVGGASGEW